MVQDTYQEVVAAFNAVSTMLSCLQQQQVLLCQQMRELVHNTSVVEICASGYGTFAEGTPWQVPAVQFVPHPCWHIEQPFLLRACAKTFVPGEEWRPG